MTIDFNELGAEGFRDLCHEAMRELLGASYLPYSAGGPDGGCDGVFDGTPRHQPDLPGYWVTQIKFHPDAIDARGARRRFLREVQLELAAWSKRLARGARQPDVLVFLTNVTATGVPETGTRTVFERLRQESALPIGRVELWDGVKLRHEHGRVSRVASGNVVFDVDCEYSEDHNVVIAVADIGNETDRDLTLRDVELRVDGIGVLRPSEHKSTLHLPGAVFAGPGPRDPVGAGRLVRVWWIFRPPDLTLKERLRESEPVSVTWEATCFPRRILRKQLDLYTIRRLREFEDQGQS